MVLGRRHPESLTQKAAHEIGLYRKVRHARAEPSEGRRRFRSPMSRTSMSYGSGTKKDVDGRNKPGHDEKANHFHAARKSLKILAAFSVRLSG
jgi:hypothetical protein